MTQRNWILLLLGAGVGTVIMGSLSWVMKNIATSVIPGWHITIYPPVYLAGAALSMLFLLQICLVALHLFSGRRVPYATVYLSRFNLILLAFTIMLGAFYAFELFAAWYSGYLYEQFAFYNRVYGDYWFYYFLGLGNMLITPLTLAFSKMRNSHWATLIVCLLTQAGMLVERLYGIYKSFGF
jgi:hypothetical protein